MQLNHNFNFSKMEKLCGLLLKGKHDKSTLNSLKAEINRFFTGITLTDILYTNNTDKLFFGMRVYPILSKHDAIGIFNGEEDNVRITKYIIEFDDKLFDPLLYMTDREIVAMILHEIGHIVYDNEGVDEIRKHLDIYFYQTDKYVLKPENCTDLMVYALKDAIFKYGSLFSKIGNTEILADTFCTSFGYGEDLESAFRKITYSPMYLNNSVDNRFIVLSWALRVSTSFKLSRIPAVRMLNKAKQLTGSELEKQEIETAQRSLNSIKVEETNVFENIKDRYVKKVNSLKVKGIKGIQNDVFELNLRLRCAETEADLLYIIRTANTDIAILQDYLTEDGITQDHRNAVNDSLNDLYEIREKASKQKNVVNKYSSMIQVVYPTM